MQDCKLMAFNKKGNFDFLTACKEVKFHFLTGGIRIQKIALLVEILTFFNISLLVSISSSLLTFFSRHVSR